MLATGHSPERNAVLGALIVLVFYTVLSGRVFCAWVCPVNAVTDAASSLRRRLDIRGGADLPRNTRLWMLGLVVTRHIKTGDDGSAIMPVHINLGISDGAFTEITEPCNLAEGQEIITGIETASSTKKTVNPFAPQMPGGSRRTNR